MKSRSFYVASGLWVLIVLLAIIQSAGTLAVDWHPVPDALRPNGSTVAGAVTVVVMATVGWLIAVRRPRNLVGWLMLSIAFTGATLSIPGPYAGYALYVQPGLPGALWIYWLSQLTWLLLFGQLLVVLPLVFPDGKLLSRRWLIPIGLFGVIYLLGAISALDPAATAPLPNPAGIRQLSGAVNILNSPVFLILFLAACSSGLISLVVRYRRGREQEREQLKWLLAAVIGFLLLFIVQLTVPPLSNAPLLAIGAGLPPIAIGIAVLRYRLYDIDLIINKALVYGGLAAIITAIYVLVVVGIGAIVGNSRQFLLSILTTAVIALAFQPLRQRAQRLANRLVYGKRATPYEALSEFSEHLSETFSQEDILDRMSRILAHGTGADRAEIWVRAGDRLLLASSSATLNGSPPAELRMENGTLPPMERDLVVAVSHRGEILGALTVMNKRGETMNDVEQKLVNDLAGQAGLVLKNVGLNRELLARLEDLRASRQRLVAAQDDERRRIERNLHDGAQQHLVALKIKLGLAEAVAEPASKVRGMLTQLKADADEALTTMRELARGIYPPLLASDGLPAALRAQARRIAVPVELELADVPRQPRELEGAIYFCCLEALQNLSKHAEASRVNLRLWSEGRTLAFEVADNGKGFDLNGTTDRHGIENMRDRLEALGGTLTIKSTPGQGTTIAGTIPMTAPGPS
ncbi:MAG: sensor histidine kinase [Chloroflexi bacterium]|nr:MAG: sensor histidine kinase [Chloroflexota bacterium]